MSVKSVEFFTIVCDRCGADAFRDEEFSAWNDKDGATETFSAMQFDIGWTQRDGKHACPKHPFCERCGEDAGELYGERDYMCPSCFARVLA